MNGNSFSPFPNLTRFLLRQKLWLLWLLACSLSVPVGLAVGGAVSFAIGFAWGGSKAWAFGLTIGLILTGSVIGLAQWLVLRRKILIGRWILVSSLGWTVGNAIKVAVSNAVFGTVDLALFGTIDLGLVWALSGFVGGAFGGAFGGAVVGLGQWLVLRRKIVRAWEWILASSLGWTFSNAVIGAIDLAGVGTIGLVMTWVVYGALYGVITGIALVRLLSR